ncbi:dUTPase [Tunisvirus fontaine2]|uniref:dUTP diphosphatase n=1 Tax=Tunisvirus fontaine2 TaxID=1421067 RepID=V9SFR6_9VIRU|nr:dUTPase [Tunisvirus fontaine2]AHC55176.1 deoxyuridine 5'-triphosphate nucleotidohydrolase [Tunisvirus fontaine2]
MESEILTIDPGAFSAENITMSLTNQDMTVHSGWHPIYLPVRVKSTSSHKLPEYKTEGSSGCDLRANISKDIILQPLERRLIPTGLSFAIPYGMEGQIRPRSGLALDSGITVLNSPGTIDSDYRSEIGIILINLSNEPFTVKDGDRIAQIVFARVDRISWEVVDELPETERGNGGFGSTGVQ